MKRAILTTLAGGLAVLSLSGCTSPLALFSYRPPAACVEALDQSDEMSRLETAWDKAMSSSYAHEKQSDVTGMQADLDKLKAIQAEMSKRVALYDAASDKCRGKDAS